MVAGTGRRGDGVGQCRIYEKEGSARVKSASGRSSTGIPPSAAQWGRNPATSCPDTQVPSCNGAVDDGSSPSRLYCIFPKQTDCTEGALGHLPTSLSLQVCA